MTLLADYSVPPSDPSALVRAGIKGVMRYATGPHALSAAEARQLASLGILIGAIAEYGAQDMLNPGLWGNYAQQAAHVVEAAGQPTWAPLWYPADFDVQGQAQVEAVLESLHNAAAATPYPAGLYGGLVAIMAAKFVQVHWLWQAGGWSYGKTVSGIVILQTTQSEQIGGTTVDVDIDEGVLAEHGLWMPGMANPNVPTVTAQSILQQYGPTWYTRYAFAPPPSGMISLPEVVQGKVIGEHFVPA